MKITLPIYVETIHDPKEKEHLFRVRPLFFPQPRRQHRSLDRALARLADDLRCDLGKMGKALRHDELAAYSFCPDLEHHRLDLTLELRHHRARGRFLFVAFAALGRRLAFTPAVPEVWFDLQPGERLEDRATEVLTRHFREREKEDEDHFLTPEDLSLAAQAWVSTLELDDLHPAQEIFKAPQPFFALMGGEERVDGDAELERVGRCLNRLYPDELERAFGREKDLTELTRLLEARDHRPVLMIGPRLVGKTALLHEYVYRKTERRRSPYAARDNVWLLSPQRLISGMSYVGQWENRLLAILKAARNARTFSTSPTSWGCFTPASRRVPSLASLTSSSPTWNGATCGWSRRSPLKPSKCCGNRIAASPSCSICCRWPSVPPRITYVSSSACSANWKAGTTAASLSMCCRRCSTCSGVTLGRPFFPARLPCSFSSWPSRAATPT